MTPQRQLFFDNLIQFFREPKQENIIINFIHQSLEPYTPFQKGIYNANDLKFNGLNIRPQIN
jgi:hypothetical protein